uniref:7TM_GPCR_Srx domain-containing protein n=1 Tax=Panagrellus redivivus TaxID=6233 RepID=A0A7E5A1S5_PANRE
MDKLAQSQVDPLLLHVGIINFCCFVPVSCFCGYHLWLAAHVGDTPDNVISYIFGFVFSNFIFYNLLIIHIKKDFEHVNDARKRDTTRPFEQALAEKKILAVYNILFYSHVFVLFFIQILFVIILNNSDISVRFKSVSASSQWEERDKEFVIGAIFVLFLLLIIVAYELCTIVTILQSLYVLCLRKPKRWDAKSSGSLRYREVIRRCRRKFVRWYLPDKEKKAYYANRFEKQNDVV